MELSFSKSDDPRDWPLYSENEAARFLKMPVSTLRDWVSKPIHGVNGDSPVTLIGISPDNENRLSFNNLVEAHVLLALRKKHRVSLQAIKKAIIYAEHELKIRKLLLDDQLRTDGTDLFLEYLTNLINLSKGGQLALRKLIEASLSRIDRDSEFMLPIRLYPLVSAQPEKKTVVIDPSISFGQPVVRGSGISTAIIAQRINAGESVESVANDYSIDISAVEDAVVYEEA